MLILLPPSETKAVGGEGAPLELDRLSFPELNPARKELAADLVALAADLPASRAALGVSARQDAEIERNAVLWTSPTTPALRRYTGVLYDALDYPSLTGATGARATSRLAVGSALFGLVRADDPVPAYRLSAGSTLPGRPGLQAFWRPALEPVLLGVRDSGELVVDLRSGAYQALCRVPGAVTVNVLSERADGTRSVVSHFNKAHKGRVARLLASSRAEPGDVGDVVRLLRRAGERIEASGTALELITPA